MAKAKIEKTPALKEKTNKVLEPAGTPNLEGIQQEMANLAAENKFLKKRLQEATEQLKFMSIGEVHKRLEYLWNVITLEGATDVFGTQFYDFCVQDFIDILTPPKPEEGKAAE